jgi:hypothetical protein
VTLCSQEGHRFGAAYDHIVQVAQAANSSSNNSSASSSLSSAMDISSSAAAAGFSGSESWSDGDSSGDDDSVEGAAAPAEAPDLADAFDQYGQQQPEQDITMQQRMMQLRDEVASTDSSSSRSGSVAPDVSAARVSVHKLFEELRPMLLTPSPAEAVLDTAAADAKAAAGTASRRRRRKDTVGQQAQQQQTAEPQQQQRSGSADLGAVEYGVVCELLPGMQPPALHEGKSVIYMLYTNDAWWYGGETQVGGQAAGQGG